MGTKDPGTTSSDGLKIKIILPKEDSLDGIELDVNNTELILSSAI
jgi:hypothetical protein